MLTRNPSAARHWTWLAVAVAAAICAVALTDADEGRQKDAITTSTPDVSVSKDLGLKRFEIRVVDYDTLAPVSGATVKFELEYYSANSRTNEATTAADGKASIEFDPVDLRRLAYRVAKSGYVAPRGEWLKQQTALLPGEFELKISQGVEIGGTVTDRAGKPIQGAEIFFDRPINMILSESDHPVHTRKWTVPAGERLAVTDGAGVWRANRASRIWMPT